MLKQIGKGVSSIYRISTFFRYTTDEKENQTFDLESPQSSSYRFERFKKQQDTLKTITIEGCPTPPNVFMGISEKPLDESTISVLHTKPEESEIQIRRLDGGLYLFNHFYHSILDKAFGIGGWSIIPLSKPSIIQFQDNWSLIREFGLYCEGRFLAMAAGEAFMYGLNQQKTVLVAGYEIAKRDGLRACCREIGIAQDLHIGDFANSWREKYAEKIMCENTVTKVNKFLWRRKDQETSISYPWRPTSNYA